MVHFGNEWDAVLAGEFDKPYYLELREFLKREYATRTIYPNMYDIFNAFKYTPYDQVKVVVLGQDPYHEPKQAHGMAFSVQKGVDVPPSLQNIYKELHAETGFVIPNHGYLVEWAEQGVFLLNTVLTVREHAANSHKGKGWETFTDEVIRRLSDRKEPIVFLLWGANARSKAALIDQSRHLVLQSVHPSPLSAYNGFFGCNHFIRANEFLAKHGQTPIRWQLSLD
ncbi:MAG: uracil-DNA glycosylase [Clostridia bacterium]|nr:uracil-DNA glycosylase [Clostridia bacterium]